MISVGLSWANMQRISYHGSGFSGFEVSQLMPAHEGSLLSHCVTACVLSLGKKGSQLFTRVIYVYVYIERYVYMYIFILYVRHLSKTGWNQIKE